MWYERRWREPVGAGLPVGEHGGRVDAQIVEQAR
jgi:hypothetical protein